MSGDQSPKIDDLGIFREDARNDLRSKARNPNLGRVGRQAPEELLEQEFQRVSRLAFTLGDRLRSIHELRPAITEQWLGDDQEFKAIWKDNEFKIEHYPKDPRPLYVCRVNGPEEDLANPENNFPDYLFFAGDPGGNEYIVGLNIGGAVHSNPENAAQYHTFAEEIDAIPMSPEERKRVGYINGIHTSFTFSRNETFGKQNNKMLVTNVGDEDDWMFRDDLFPSLSSEQRQKIDAMQQLVLHGQSWDSDKVTQGDLEQVGGRLTTLNRVTAELQDSITPNGN